MIELTPNLIQNIRNCYDRQKDCTKYGGFDKFLCDEIKRMKGIQSRINQKYKIIEEAKSEYEKRKTDLQNEIAAIQYSCNHELKTYYSDVYESSQVCEICGKEAKRL